MEADVLRLRIGHLVDGTAAPAQPDQAILVEDGRIVDVGPDARVARPEHARQLDYPTATALPGLIDAHVHLVIPRSHGSMLDDMLALSDDELVVLGAASAERFLRAGVTTIFDCGARGDTAFRIREAVNAAWSSAREPSSAVGRSRAPAAIAGGGAARPTAGTTFARRSSSSSTRKAPTASR